MNAPSHPAVRVVESRQEQQSLPLGDAPQEIDSLRAAFERSGLPAHGYTFDQAIADETLCRCLANIAEARLRALSEARPS